MCIACNGWMNTTFENPAKPLLIPLFAGEPLRLTPAAADVVARWAGKTVLIHAAHDRTSAGLIPPDEYRRFRAEGTPAGNCRILIGTVAEAAAGKHLRLESLRGAWRSHY